MTKKKKLLVAVLGAAIVLVLACVGVVVAIDPKALVEQQKTALLQSVSQKIGREVTAGSVQTSVGLSLFARLSNLQVAAATSGAPAQVELGSVDVRFSLWRAIASFGKALNVERFTVRNLTLRAARDGNGVWDFDDVLTKLAEPTDDQAAAPSDDNALAGVRVAALDIQNARIEIDDKILGRKLVVSSLNVRTSDVELDKKLAVHLDALLEDKSSTSPVKIDVALAKLPKDLVFDPLPDTVVEVHASALDLGVWGGLLPSESPAPAAGTLDVDVTLEARHAMEVLRAKGKLALTSFVLRGAAGPQASAQERLLAPRGRPYTGALTIDLERGDGGLKLRTLTLSGDGTEITASATVKGEGLTGIQTAQVDGKVADLSKLLEVFPAGTGIPAELKVEGPLRLQASADNGALTVGVALDGAHVRYLDLEDGAQPSTASAALFDKPAGTAFSLDLHAARGKDSLDFDKLALTLGTAKVTGTLQLPDSSDAPMVCDIHSGKIVLSTLKDLVPPFREALGRGEKVDGTVELSVQAHGGTGAAVKNQEATAALEMAALDVNLARTQVRGAGFVRLNVSPQADGMAAQVNASLDGLAVKKTGDGGAQQFQKPAGFPLRLAVDVKRAGTRTDVSKAELVLGTSTVKGTGSLVTDSAGKQALDVDLGAVRLAFADLRQAIPSAAKLPAAGAVTGQVKLAGAPTLAGLALKIANLAVTFGSSTVTGDVDIKNLDTPVLDVNLGKVNVAFDDVRALSASAADLPAGGRFVGDLQVRGDTARASSVSFKSRVDTLVAADSTLKGTLQVQNLDAPQFQLALEGDMLDVDRLRAAFGSTSAPGNDKAMPRKDDNPHGLSKDTRALLADVNGKATLKTKRAVVKGIPVQNFDGTLVMTRGKVRFDTLSFGLYGGTVVAKGTTLDLPAERLGYDLHLDAKDVDLGAALAAHTGLGRIFEGKVSPKLEVKGRGLGAGDFAISADGPAALTFKSLSIKTLDLLAPITDALKVARRLGGMKLDAAAARGNTQGLTLDGFLAETRFFGGKLKLDKPVDANSPLGKVHIEGAAGLDAALDLKTTLALTPDVISKLTGGKVKLKNAVPVPMRLQGTWDKPRITGVDVEALVTALAAELGKDAAGKAIGGVLDSVTGGGKKDDAKGGKKSASDKAVDAVKGLLPGKKKR